MANIVIFKWNPAISSYNLSDFLTDIGNREAKSDWSVYEYQKVGKGDIFYMLKAGQGQNGIVMRGEIISNPFCSKDWSGMERKVFYCRYKAEIMINPDTLPLLSSPALHEEIPEFDWFGGHSGMVLETAQAEKLEQLWLAYLQNQKAEFQNRLAQIQCRRAWNDQLYIAPAMFKKLFSEKV